jgi:predicted kinase
VSEKVYGILRTTSADILVAGHGVVVDAVHLTAAERKASEAVAKAAGCAFTGLWLEGEVKTLVERVGARKGDASDADAAVVRSMSAKDVGPIEWSRIDCSGTVTETLSRIFPILDHPVAAG